MTKKSKMTEFQVGRGSSKTDWDAVSDTPAATSNELKAAQSFDAVFPALAERARRMRGPQKAPVKTRITLRIEQATLEAFKATGKGWQTRMDAALKAALPIEKR